MTVSIKSRYLLLVTIIALIAGSYACGYQLRSKGESVGINLKSIAIPLIGSNSSDMGFEADFTRIIRQEFISHAKMPVVAKAEADAVLTGEITEIDVTPLTYNMQSFASKGNDHNYEATSSRRLKIRLSFSLIKNESGKLIWHDSRMEEEASYKVSADPLANRYNKQQALMKIATLLSKRIYMKTMERF